MNVFSTRCIVRFVWCNGNTLEYWSRILLLLGWNTSCNQYPASNSFINSKNWHKMFKQKSTENTENALADVEGQSEGSVERYFSWEAELHSPRACHLHLAENRSSSIPSRRPWAAVSSEKTTQASGASVLGKICPEAADTRSALKSNTMHFTEFTDTKLWQCELEVDNRREETSNGVITRGLEGAGWILLPGMGRGRNPADNNVTKYNQEFVTS